MDTELEVKEIEIPDIDPEGNFELPVVDMEGQEPPPQVIEIGDPDIPQDPIIIEPKTALDIPTGPEVSTRISLPATEGPHIYTRVIPQPYTYTPIMTGKMY